MYPLFVYGTLAPNRPNHHIMTPINHGHWQPAYAFGELLPNGWGMEFGYPAFIPNENNDKTGDKVEGFIFNSPELNQHWERLDEFEGDDYQRVVITVYLENNEPVQAYVYALVKHKN